MVLAGESTTMKILAVTSVLCSVIVTGLVVRRVAFGEELRSNQAEIQPSPVKDWDKHNTGGHWMGPKSARVTIVEFADFECPVCRQFTLGAVRGVRAEFPDDVALVFRHWPLPYHRFSYVAARAAECAGVQDHFEQFHDQLFSQQDSLGLKPFLEIAREAGVPNVAEFARCTAVKTPNPAIERDRADAIAIGGTGTPTLVVNGKRLRGAPDSARFSTYVRKLLQK